MKAYGYTRLSQKSDTSIEDQKKHIRKYAEQENLNLIEIFDDGEKTSGYKNDREQYQQMLNQLQRVEAIIVRDRTRFGRDKLERMQRFIELYRKNVDIHIVSERTIVDFEDDFELVKESFHAEKDDAAKREEIEKAKKKIEERKEKGYYHGRPPFGLKYDEDKHFLVPDSGFSKCLRVLSMREDGKTFEEIGSELGLNLSKVYRVWDRRDLYRRKEREFN